MKFYKYKLSECEVEDVAKLKRYREKRRSWIKRLKSKIIPEICDMMYDEAIFWTINEARMLASNRDAKSAVHNPFLSRALRRGYVATQLMAIRRLVDDSKDSHSLLKLVKDIKKHNGLFTREVCVCFDGLPYHYAEIRQNWMKSLSESGDGGWMTTEGPEAWSKSADLHGYFDSLSGSDFESRERSQFIPKRVFRELEDKLSRCSKVVTVATKKLAHIGKDNMQSGNVKQSWPTFDEIRDAQRCICEVAYEISGSIFQDSTFMPVPTPAFGCLDNYLEFLDQPVAERIDFDGLHEYWDKLNKEIESWVGIGRP